jgi:SpoVK/Ycf46/Vps4 family AAA+-type ATPase
MKPNLETIRFFTMRGMMQYCDKYAGVYSQYIFAIPLMRYLRVDPLPDIMDPAVRKKYRLKEIVERVLNDEEDGIEMVES